MVSILISKQKAIIPQYWVIGIDDIDIVTINALDILLYLRTSKANNSSFLNIVSLYNSLAII